MPAPSTVRVDDGVRVESRVTALSRVACYVPGGRFPLPSTAIMTVVPATVAGVKDIAVVCPSPAPVVLAAALAAGATSVHRLGGAQAIAAAAYGTRSLPRVDKIVGPGNRWVTAAKMLVAGDCAIDFRAGPSEIVIWSDAGRPDWIAHDLAAQAEHDPDARAILLTTRLSLAKNVHARLLVIGLAANVSIHVGNRRQIVALINELSPEHLVVDRAPDADECIAATTFVGEWSAQASGDYCTGSNHVLPTGGGARTRGGLTPADFVRVSTVQRLTRRGLRGIGPAVVTLARAEGLRAHARSIEVRLEDTGR
jgi:histidinol dehydrogenase